MVTTYYNKIIQNELSRPCRQRNRGNFHFGGCTDKMGVTRVFIISRILKLNLGDPHLIKGFGKNAAFEPRII